MMNIKKEKEIFINEFFAHGPAGIIIDPTSDNGEKIEDYFERKLIEATGQSEKRKNWLERIIKKQC